MPRVQRVHRVHLDTEGYRSYKKLIHGFSSRKFLSPTSLMRADAQGTKGTQDTL